MDMDGFLSKVDVLFGNLSRLIKKSNYKERVIKPIIMTLGTSEMERMVSRTCPFTFSQLQGCGLTLWDQMFAGSTTHMLDFPAKELWLRMVHKIMKHRLLGSNSDSTFLMKIYGKFV